jgi:single-strand DNA-binding protein
LQTRDWEDSEGKKRYTTEVIAREMTMLDSRGDSETSSSHSSASAPKQNDDKHEEDIPF